MVADNTQALINTILSDDGQSFIEKNLSEDTNKLYLKYSKYPEKKILIDQIFIRKKINKKLPEWYQKKHLIFNKSVSHEQASSEATAKLKSNLIRGKLLLDLTGGMGVDHYYMAQSFEASVYVEKQEELFQITKHNLQSLNLNNISFEFGDGIEAIENYKADVIYVDPARRDERNEKLVSLKDCEPNVLNHLDKLISHHKVALIKTSPMLDIKKALDELKNVFEIWVISHKNECKELVYLLKNEITQNPLVKTFNILTNGELEEFDFLFNLKSQVELATLMGSYVYEPNSSLQKSRGGDHIAKSKGLKKLHPDTNLYTSDSLIDSFPGKTFKVINELKPYHSSLKKQRLNVISRNYPDKANVIQQKLRLNTSQLEYLIACKTSFNNYVFILAQQLK